MLTALKRVTDHDDSALSDTDDSSENGDFLPVAKPVKASAVDSRAIRIRRREAAQEIRAAADKMKYQSSAKIDKAMELLKKIQAGAGGAKTIMFSQWTSFLDLLEVPLEREFTRSYYRRFDGTMKPDERNAVVQEFMQNDDVKLLILSLKAGNVGLNLTAATHVIILDPFCTFVYIASSVHPCVEITRHANVII